MRRRMIVSPRVAARTETGASADAHRSQAPPIFGTPRRKQERARLKRRGSRPRDAWELRRARSRKRRPISRRCAPHWPISTAAHSSGPPPGLCLRTASPAHGSCSSARPRERMKIGSGGRSSEGRGNCWIACWGRSDWIGRQSMSPMSFPGARRAIERRRPRRRRSVCLSSSGRSTSPILNILVCLGGSASSHDSGRPDGIMRARGSWFAYPRQDGREIRALAMLHPAFLLRQPAHKRFAWADMRALANALEIPTR